MAIGPAMTGGMGTAFIFSSSQTHGVFRLAHAAGQNATVSKLAVSVKMMQQESPIQPISLKIDTLIKASTRHKLVARLCVDILNLMA